MSERFYMPSMSLMGAGCIEEVPAEIKELGLTKALIVTDKSVKSNWSGGRANKTVRAKWYSIRNL